MEWNPDDIALTVEAYHQLQTNPLRRPSIVSALANELKRDESAVAAAIEAVGNPSLRARTAGAIISALVGNVKETRRIARIVRALRGRF